MRVDKVKQRMQEKRREERERALLEQFIVAEREVGFPSKRSRTCERVVNRRGQRSLAEEEDQETMKSELLGFVICIPNLLW